MVVWGVRYLGTIPVPKDRAFEAPAIEEYLKGRLNPQLCGIGRTASFDESPAA